MVVGYPEAIALTKIFNHYTQNVKGKKNKQWTESSCRQINKTQPHKKQRTVKHEKKKIIANTANNANNNNKKPNGEQKPFRIQAFSVYLQLVYTFAHCSKCRKCR